MTEKPLRPKELRELSEADLTSRLEALRSTLWQRRLKVRDGSSQQTHESRAIRRQIARTLTILREKHRVPA